MTNISSDTDPTTAPVSEADIDELFASLRPKAYKMRAMVHLALSREGLRHDLFGRGRYSQEALGRAESAAARAGFVIEQHPLEDDRVLRTVLRRRWVPALRPGLAALLNWNNGCGQRGVDLGLAAWLSEPERRSVAIPLLQTLAAWPEMANLLGRHPRGFLLDGHYDEEMLGWLTSTVDTLAILVDATGRGGRGGGAPPAGSPSSSSPAFAGEVGVNGRARARPPIGRIPTSSTC
jgi:hypothetical protein